MKKNYLFCFFYILLLCLTPVTALTSFSQTVIQMEYDGGVYKIPCKVNGLKMKFIFDTGASAVCLSSSMADFLYENDYIDEGDIIGTGKSKVADGRTVDNLIINLKDIEIEGMHLRNVEALVSSSQKAPLLLGQSAILKLGKISIEGSRLTIHDHSQQIDDAEIDRLEELLDDYMDAGSYESALDCLLKLKNSIGLSREGMEDLAKCYYMSDDYSNCIVEGKEYLRLYENNSKSKDEIDSRSRVIYYIAHSYLYLKDQENTIKYAQKLKQSKDKIDEFESDYIILISYNDHSRYADAMLLAKKLINKVYEYMGYDIKKILTSSTSNVLFQNSSYFRNLASGIILNYQLASNRFYGIHKDYNTGFYYGDELAIFGAKCGFPIHIQECERRSINYKRTQSCISIFE